MTGITSATLKRAGYFFYEKYFQDKIYMSYLYSLLELCPRIPTSSLPLSTYPISPTPDSGAFDLMPCRRSGAFDFEITC
jgi:hypothetical protein